MAWVNDDSPGGGQNGQREQPPFRPYLNGIEFASIAANQTRHFLFLTGVNDKSNGQWLNPVAAWVHSYMVQGKGLITLFCTKFHSYPCPLCFDDEVNKIRGTQKKYGLSKKALAPVYDLVHKRVAFYLIPNDVVKAIEFKMQHNPQVMDKPVMIGRSDNGGRTSYMIDFDTPPMTQEQKMEVAAIANIPPFSYDLFVPTPEQFMVKTGINVPIFFEQRSREMSQGLIPPVDISNWGVMPALSQAAANQHPVTTAPPTPAPVMPATPPSMPAQPLQAQLSLPGNRTEAEQLKMPDGMFSGQTLLEIMNKAGKPYIKFLSTQHTNDVVKQAAAMLLD